MYFQDIFHIYVSVALLRLLLKASLFYCIFVLPTLRTRPRYYSNQNPPQPPPFKNRLKMVLSAKCLLVWSHKNVSYLWSEFLWVYTPCSLVSMMIHVGYQVAGTYKSCCWHGILYLHPPSTVVLPMISIFVCLGGWGLCFAFVFCQFLSSSLGLRSRANVSATVKYLSLIPWSFSGPSSQWLRSHATSLLYEESYLFSHR